MKMEGGATVVTTSDVPLYSWPKFLLILLEAATVISRKLPGVSIRIRCGSGLCKKNGARYLEAEVAWQNRQFATIKSCINDGEVIIEAHGEFQVVEAPIGGHPFDLTHCERVGSATDLARSLGWILANHRKRVLAECGTIGISLQPLAVFD